MPTRPEPKPTVEELRNYAARLGDMLAEAHRLGLHETGHALHDGPIQKVGYEIEYMMKQDRCSTH